MKIGTRSNTDFLLTLLLLIALGNVSADIYSETLLHLGKYVEESQMNRSATERLIKAFEKKPLKSLYADSLQEQYERGLGDSENISTLCQHHLDKTSVALFEGQLWALQSKIYFVLFFSLGIVRKNR